MEIRDAYQKVSDTMLAAVMFHADMMECFRFLGLHGFACLHECRMKEELCERVKLREHYAKCHLMLLEDGADRVTRREVIQKDWYKYRSLDVTKNVAWQAVKKAISEYVAWEGYAHSVYQDAAKGLLDDGYVSDADYMACIADGTAKELQDAEHLQIKLNIVDYDMVYVLDIQERIKEKHKKKIGKMD